MRFIHTADWHLGRVYHSLSLLDNQAHMLDHFVALVSDLRPDAVLVAGDVYDRSVPPADAVRLLDDTLTRIVIGAGIPVVLIAGNHDGPDRLGFGSRLLSSAGLTVRGVPAATSLPVIFKDADGEVAVYPLPYADPAQSRQAFEDETLLDHHMALALQMHRLRAAQDPARRSVVVAHAFVQGGSVTDSERPLSVGGTGSVGTDVFAGIDYVALGHLHRPQVIGDNDRIHYAGSLLKYSFAEADHGKSVSVVELNDRRELTIERIGLVPRHDLRILEGTLQSLIEAAAQDTHREDYVLARLTDSGALLDAMTKLRTAYPNALSIERPQFAGRLAGLEGGRDHRRVGMQELFSGFYQEMTGTPLAPAAVTLLQGELGRQAQLAREVQA
ncbi:MAG: exonuclease SbcCD subunit D [Sulfuritalea sp.]|nr:exonuclease SbcCD subunit D [Sulfuritalea sp.]